MRLILPGLALWAASFLAGCSTRPPSDPQAPSPLAPLAALFPRKKVEQPPAAQPAASVGLVKQVNAEGGFALLESTGLGLPAAGTALVVIDQGRLTAELQVTELRSPPFVIADILSGQPAPGQRAFLKD